MSKDTGRPESRERYRDAWELLASGESESSVKEFEVLNWQLKAVTESASSADLTVEYIKTKKNQYAQRWPPIIKRRVIIAGRNCVLYSAARLSQDPNEPEYNYVLFKVSGETWPDFQIHIVRSTDNSPDLFRDPQGPHHARDDGVLRPSGACQIQECLGHANCLSRVFISYSANSMARAKCPGAADLAFADSASRHPRS
jgi:hypothetical protein